MLISSTTSTMSVPKVRNTSVKSRFCTARNTCQNMRDKECLVCCSPNSMPGNLCLLLLSLGSSAWHLFCACAKDLEHQREILPLHFRFCTSMPTCQHGCTDRRQVSRRAIYGPLLPNILSQVSHHQHEVLLLHSHSNASGLGWI